jgi:RNA polymerase sigma factor (sigma-70 family)
MHEFAVSAIPAPFSTGPPLRWHTRGMLGVNHERAHWLGRNILPHEPALRAWLAKRKTHGLEIDDIVQETYAVLAELPSVTHIRNPRTYLFSVAHSIVLQQLRRLRIVPIHAVAEIDSSNLHVDEIGPERQVGDYQELHRVAELIAGLPAQCRQAFRLRKVDGLSQREIASRMGLSENTVEKHISKAVRLLMKAMEETHEAERLKDSSRRARHHGKVKDET